MQEAVGPVDGDLVEDYFVKQSGTCDCFSSILK